MVPKTIPLVAAYLLASMSVAHADAQSEEWRYLGPAFSFHLTTTGAQATPTAPVWNCNKESIASKPITGAGYVGYVQTRTVTSTFSVSSPADPLNNFRPTGEVFAQLDQKFSGYVGYLPLDNSGSQRYVATGGMVRNAISNFNEYSEVTCNTTGPGSQKTWSQNNPAIGLEKSWRYTGYVDYVDKAFGTIVKDSYGTPSVMLGVARLFTVGTSHGVTLDAGAVAGLWWRSTLDEENTLHRALVPYVFPSIAITEERTGLGINVALAPKLSIRGRIIVPTTTLMFQTTLLLHKSEAGQTTLSVKTESDGFTANLSKSF